MSDTVLIVLVIASTVVAILFMVRARLSRFVFKADREGLATEIETDSQHRNVQELSQASQQTPSARGIRISNTLQAGKGHLIDVGRDSVEIQDNTQLGEGQSIVVRPDDPSGT